MWETTVMHKQVSGWTVNFGPNFPESPPPPHFGKLQIWDDQSLLRNTPPISKKFRFGMTKVYSGIPPPHPISQNFRFRMTKVYSGIPPHFGKLQIWDDQSLLRNTPPPHWKLSESPSPRVSEYRELLHVETLSNPDNYSLPPLHTSTYSFSVMFSIVHDFRSIGIIGVFDHSIDRLPLL